MCRHCGAVGDHFSLKCPYKEKLQSAKEMDDPSAGSSSGGAGRYVAPGARNRGQEVFSPFPSFFSLFPLLLFLFSFLFPFFPFYLSQTLSLRVALVGTGGKVMITLFVLLI